MNDDPRLAPIPYPLFPTEEPLVWRTKQGDLYYVPGEGKRPQCLAGCDSVAGVWIFNRGVDDPDREFANWHDHAYENFQFYESLGWTRKDIDTYYYLLRKWKRGESLRLTTDYYLIRAAGWLPYNLRKYRYWRSKQNAA